MDLFKGIPMHMDYFGQQQAERFSRMIITMFALAGLIWGYILQQFLQTIYILFAGFTLAACLTIPAWPMYRTKPLNWQPSRNLDGDSHSVKETSKKSQKKNK